ncbi:hypothetical protein GCM10027403_16140 [Arthrobacter tecti]
MMELLPQRAPWWWYPGTSGGSSDSLIPRQFPVSRPGQHWIRAIDIHAPAEELFAWVTQLRRAPYSYDWADNFGRRSPQAIDRSQIHISVGDPVMTIFTAVAVVPGKSITLSMNEGMPISLFGALTVHYEVECIGSNSRLIVEMVVPLPPGPLKSIRRYALAWGDLFMMRKQLKELKRLAELSASRAC